MSWLPLPGLPTAGLADTIIKSRMAQNNSFAPGIAGQIQGLQVLKNQYGESSPIYQKALNAFNNQQNAVNARAAYENILSNTAPKRFSTTLGKTQQEKNDINNGYIPGTKIPISDDEKTQYLNMYGLYNLKQTSDQQARQKDLYANNIDITLKSIDPNKLTVYSGPQGKFEYYKDKLSSLGGNAPTRLNDYETAATRAGMLSKQVRQFYGDSITPTVQNELQFITNPTSWMNSPQIATSKYNAMVNLLKQELNTYRRGVQSPNVYTGKNDNQSQYTKAQLDAYANEARNAGIPEDQIQKRYQELLRDIK